MGFIVGILILCALQGFVMLWHHLRHTFCTRLCENETNLKVIQSGMGHKDIQTTMDVYAEATEQKKQESFERLAAKLDIF